MKQIINNIKDWIEDRLRRICAPMGSGTRITVILILIGVFAIANFYIMYKGITSIGRENKHWNLIDSPIEIPDFQLQDEEIPDSLQLEMEKFFNEQFNSIDNDTAKG